MYVRCWITTLYGSKVVLQLFKNTCIHALTLHIIAIKIQSRSPELSSSSHRPRLQKRRKKVDRNKACIRTSCWNFTFQNWRKARTGACKPTNLINLYYYLCTAFECLSLEFAWNSFDACSTSLIKGHLCDLLN